MTKTLFNSRDPAYKTPFGAVASGTNVTLSIRAPRELAVSEAVLVVAYEFDREAWDKVMTWTGLLDGYDHYTVTLPTDNRLGPVWYSFTLRRFDRPDMYIERDAELSDGSGVLTQTTPQPFLQTVYDGAFEVPDWYGKGITYHIFPDRFHRKAVPNPKGLVGDRIVHKKWEDTPDFRPEPNGEIRNRDFFGGSIAGVRDKLPYLKSLGVTTLYFSPIFEAATNHRYDTADYLAVDPMFGTQEEFSALCVDAARLDMRIILDGVFSHTGYDSRYFNGRGTYPELGARQSKDSPYYSWYDFTEWPNKYSCWWDFYTLPQVIETDPSYMDFILNKPDSVVKHWLRAGASGWRLDVADELPDEFIARLRLAARQEKPDTVVIGEVWEDAVTKISYDSRRQYLLGHELDGVMNYPFRDELLNYLLGGDAARFAHRMETLRENYPRQAFFSLMNIIGTHDTPRVLTVLGVKGRDYEQPREKRAGYRLPPETRAKAKKRLMMGVLIQITFPGSPTIYYGDEAGMEGFEDPFNRRGYPWGKEDAELLAWYKKLGALRNELNALQTGDILFLRANGPLLAFERVLDKQRVVVVTNAGQVALPLSFTWDGQKAIDAITGTYFPVKNGMLEMTIPPESGLLITPGSN